MFLVVRMEEVWGGFIMELRLQVLGSLSIPITTDLPRIYLSLTVDL